MQSEASESRVQSDIRQSVGSQSGASETTVNESETKEAQEEDTVSTAVPDRAKTKAGKRMCYDTDDDSSPDGEALDEKCPFERFTEYAKRAPDAKTRAQLHSRQRRHVPPAWAATQDVCASASSTRPWDFVESTANPYPPLPWNGGEFRPANGLHLPYDEYRPEPHLGHIPWSGGEFFPKIDRVSCRTSPPPYSGASQMPNFRPYESFGPYTPYPPPQPPPYANSAISPPPYSTPPAPQPAYANSAISPPYSTPNVSPRSPWLCDGYNLPYNPASPPPAEFHTPQQSTELPCAWLQSTKCCPSYPA